MCTFSTNINKRGENAPNREYGIPSNKNTPLPALVPINKQPQFLPIQKSYFKF